MADIKRIGFGQIEPNHLSAQRTAQIYAQLPAEASIKVLENGQFAKYDYLKKEVNFTGEGEWMLVYNEVKLYDDAWRETYKDFALQKKNYTEGVMTPRVFKTNVGDIFTTNCVGVANTSGTAVTSATSISEGDLMKPDDATGYLVTGADASADPMVWQVVKITTMPDGQDAVKLMRIK